MVTIDEILKSKKKPKEIENVMKRNTTIALVYWLTLAVIIFAAGKVQASSG